MGLIWLALTSWGWPFFLRSNLGDPTDYIRGLPSYYKNIEHTKEFTSMTTQELTQLAAPARLLQNALRNRWAFELDLVCEQLNISIEDAEMILFVTNQFYKDYSSPKLNLWLKK
jgi:hypothetical protein